MPTYEYECMECGHSLEAFQPISASPLRECPKCKGWLKRLIGTGAGVIFKGAGFYATDYRSSEYKKKAKEESGKNSASKETKEQNKPPPSPGANPDAQNP